VGMIADRGLAHAERQASRQSLSPRVISSLVLFLRGWCQSYTYRGRQTRTSIIAYIS
jgi:hypothetical protein